MTNTILSLQDVLAATKRICEPGFVAGTPMLSVPFLAKAAGFKSLWIKNETANPVGAFKLRGAYNHFLQMTGEQKKSGVFAVSSGNHAQAVAYVARQFKIAATILMPQDAPRLKLDKTRGHGAEVITYDRKQDRDAIARQISEERGPYFVHPYNDPLTIAGQGTVGVEIYKQTREKGIAPDAIVVPCSGGGLAAGIALTRDLYENPPTLFTAEPKAFDDACRSLKAGFAMRNPENSRSVCDALQAPSLGSNTFPILLRHGARGLTVSDVEVSAAMYLAAIHPNFGAGLKLEPSGATALACALARRGELEGKNVVVIASGANVDPQMRADILLSGGYAAAGMLPKLAW